MVYTAGLEPAARKGLEGSNPSLSTISLYGGIVDTRHLKCRIHSGCAGANPARATKLKLRFCSSGVEHLFEAQGVVGAKPTGTTKYLALAEWLGGCLQSNLTSVRFR